MKTWMPKIKKGENPPRNWYLIDADGLVLGRLASQISKILQGKHKPTYTPHIDCGDFVVVVNADKVVLTGKKALQKKYYYHTGYMRGLREVSFEEMKRRHPTEILRTAVRRMLPKNRLGRKMLKKLKIYTGSEHPHGAQQPVAISPLKSSKSRKE
ncbi:MAG: 50S ribosomal protein L13 [Planctomycetota bacterium]|nr:MAG: 50S ribosomal protein L13 [Planctomycetota bacterium]